MDTGTAPRWILGSRGYTKPDPPKGSDGDEGLGILHPKATLISPQGYSSVTIPPRLSDIPKGRALPVSLLEHLWHPRAQVSPAAPGVSAGITLHPFPPPAAPATKGPAVRHTEQY